MMGPWGHGLTMREFLALILRSDRLNLFPAAQHAISIHSRAPVMRDILNFQFQSITYPIWIRPFACYVQDVLIAVT